ncbi:lipopolysaccharide heptosyltransferase I, partial [Haliea sp. AH-315-K21]|nr:lipopolysaccharide heptosyltransferase I [Haliea sp. AH-315-K21]
PAWHATVNKVIPVAFRRWKKNILKMFFSREYKHFKKQLNHTKYDLIIDAQGLFKSGFICSLAKGKVVGLDKNSAREKISTWFYDECYAVSKQQHAVERTRELFAQALGYSVDKQAVDYGLPLSQFDAHTDGSSKSLYFLHGTTWETKLWPEQYWIELGEIAVNKGYRIKLLWGSKEEQQRAERIAKAIPNATVMSQLTLTEIAGQLLQTDIVIAVDTGLAHLAAALNRPTIALYGASDADKTGTYGKNQVHLSASLACSPCLQKKCNYQGDDLSESEKQQIFAVNPPCFSTVTPDRVWQNIVEFKPT